MTEPATPDVWWILSVSSQDPERNERLAEAIAGLSGQAAIELSTPGQEAVWMEGYFASEEAARLAWLAIENNEGPLQAAIRPCPNKDWTTFWRHHFKPQAIGTGLYVLPEWLRADPLPAAAEGRALVLVNPGLSFGTGDHFTTRYCLECIDTLAGQGFRPDSMLDAGCGSAILAIAARKVGWTGILAVDNDPVAIAQANENLLLNGITDGIRCEVMDLAQSWPGQRFDLVIANIYGGLLIELAPRLLRAAAKTLILSGIRAIEAEAVSSVFAQLGCREISSSSDHEWCGLWFEIPETHPFPAFAP